MTTDRSDDFTDEELAALAEPVIKRLLADPPTVHSGAHDDSLDAATRVWAASLYGYAAKPSFAPRDFGVISVNTVA